ncbi:hypothetical protein [Prosthecobacter sp.]|jgi:hypothetical protein|uniref:hypothetical protein n=1 Tax=Prosthecobacter sp. TaxID=1965333 RepID=UPI0037C5B766
MTNTRLICLLCLNFIAAPVPAIDGNQGNGPVVSFDATGPEIFPQSWLTAKVNAQATILDPAQRERSQALVARALAKYPAVVLRTHLQRVYVVGGLAYSGVPTGGTNSRNVVYLANSGKASDAALEGILHAEFSSILLRNLPQHLDTKRWQEINPPDFRYLGSGVQAIKQQKASRQLDAALQEAGFLHAYAQASQEEDFNSIASRLLMGDEGLWRAVAQFPKVKEKTLLVVAFYGRLHPQFTQSWFEALRSGR